MENNYRNNRQPKRRRTQAARRAYIRASVVGLSMVMVVGVSVFAFTRFLKNRPEASVDAVASATYNPISSGQLNSLLSIRVQNLFAAAEQQAAESPAETPVDPATTGEAVPATPAVPQYTLPTKFEASSMGSSGYSSIADWKQKNGDVRGWLKIPNTNIDYPVVVGSDNLYYNTLGYDKQYSKNGVVWADSDTKFGTSSQISQNNVLYGHNWTNYSANPSIGRASDVMFGQLTAFHHLNFAKVTPYIYYSTGDAEMTWKVFAVFYTEDSFNYITSDPGATGLQSIIDEAKSRSRHSYDVAVDSTDKILTLSTCTRAYGATSKQRFVVMARLMRSGETVSEVSITDNPNHKKPSL